MDEFEQTLLALHDLLRALEVPDDTEFTLPLPSGSLTLVKRTFGNVTLGPCLARASLRGWPGMDRP